MKAIGKTRLTELEGSVLTEIGHRGARTSFKVRKAFRQSPSSSWSGSAGAVYSAIERLIRAGLIEAEPGPTARGTRLLALSASGRSALEEWFGDVEAACTIGADPFRSRAGLWETLEPKRRVALLKRMREGVLAEMAKLENRDDLDFVEGIGNALARNLQQLRLDWLDEAERRARTGA